MERNSRGSVHCWRCFLYDCVLRSILFDGIRFYEVPCLTVLDRTTRPNQLTQVTKHYHSIKIILEYYWTTNILNYSNITSIMSATSTPTATSNDDSRPSSNRYCFVCLKELKGSEQEPAAPKPEQKEQHNLTQCCTTCKHPGTGAARLALERAGYEQIRTRTRIDSDTNSNDG